MVCGLQNVAAYLISEVLGAWTVPSEENRVLLKQACAALEVKSFLVTP